MVSRKETTYSGKIIQQIDYRSMRTIIEVEIFGMAKKIKFQIKDCVGFPIALLSSDFKDGLMIVAILRQFSDL